MSIWIGTAAWADKGLTDCGRFYPPEVTTPAGRLHYYTTQFPLVEVDSSFYAIPAVRTAEQWAERTPEGFVMNAKAFRLFTGHQTSPAALPADVRDALPLELKAKAVLYYREIPLELLDELWQQFGASLAPLREAGRLGLVHFQFPPWLLRNRAGHAHVEQCVERMHGFNLSVQFRNASWFDGFHARETLSFERALKVVHTVVDEPQGISNSVRPLWEITHSQYARVRMHGRNADAWNNMGGRSSGRFDYLYDEAELERLGWSIRDAGRQSTESARGPEQQQRGSGAEQRAHVDEHGQRYGCGCGSIRGREHAVAIRRSARRDAHVERCCLLKDARQTVRRWQSFSGFVLEACRLSPVCAGPADVLGAERRRVTTNSATVAHRRHRVLRASGIRRTLTH
jgi:uncharacterized protein YecE (DUF72 family)